MKWTIGADIEMMLERNGTLISAIPLLPKNTKPAELPHGTVFHDNVLAEFTVTPAENADDFRRNILSNIQALKGLLVTKGVETRAVASARYPERELRCDTAKRFGCSPDYDAYDLVVNQVANDACDTDLRTAGGHIHFSHPIFSDPYKIVEMIKLMDLHLGVPSILKDSSPEAKQRRELYGKAGAHRPKNYPGGEYRSLSSFWANNEKDIRWVYTQTEKCLELLLSDQTVVSMGYDEQEIRRVINEADSGAAQLIVDAMS